MSTIIGITGGIGSGKTAVSNYLQSFGYTIIDADIIAREVVRPGSIGLEQLVAYFGRSILLSDGTLNRRKLSAHVFHDADARRVLNAITHPLIHRRMEELLAAEKEAGKDFIFLVVPLLYEGEFPHKLDEVWVVTVDDAVRKARIVARDGVDEVLAAKKMAAQTTDKIRFLDPKAIALSNDGNLDELYGQVDAQLRKWKEGSLEC